MPQIRLLRPIFVVAMLGIGGCGHLGVFEPAREVQCFEAAKVSLKDAIAAAEARGGKVLDADYRQDEELGCLRNNPGVYDITLLVDGKISVVSVNARSGDVGPREEESVMNFLFGGARFEGSPVDMARAMPGMSIDISQAIDIAEEQGGRAMVTWIERKDGKPGYTVKLVQRGRVHKTWIPG
jgi:uncharacterized membrane protein YkoI